MIVVKGLHAVMILKDGIKADPTIITVVIKKDRGTGDEVTLRAHLPLDPLTMIRTTPVDIGVVATILTVTRIIAVTVTVITITQLVIVAVVR
jgi:hypothetical protein